MAISIFEVAGPVMIGPSSSHTAGAARLARMAALLAEGEFRRVEFHLYGSFARTYRGHGTDLALLAGVMGIGEWDERLADAYKIAEERGLSWTFIPEERKSDYENEAQIRFFMTDGRVREIVGSSTGGGRILILGIDGFATELTCENPTAVIMHRDKKGVLSLITAEFAEHDINIALLRSSRSEKGRSACSVIEADGAIPAELRPRLEAIHDVLSVNIIDPNGGKAR